MKKILLAITLLGLFSCTSKEVNIPSEVIPKDTMLMLMMDIHLAEAGIRTVAPDDSVSFYTVSYYHFIFDKYKVDKKRFQQSLKFYTDHTELLHDIYQKMIEEMSRKEAEVLNNKQ